MEEHGGMMDGPFPSQLDPSYHDEQVVADSQLPGYINPST
jgi:hypothetical protein